MIVILLLVIIAYLHTEVMDRLSGIPVWMFWAGGMGLLGVLITLSYLPPPEPRKRNIAPGAPRSMDEYLERQRQKPDSSSPSDQKPEDPAQ